MPTRYDEDLAELQIQNSFAPASTRLDANESLFFARQLEYVRAKIYDTKRPAMSALQVFPIDRSIPEGAEYVTYRMFDGTTSAKIISAYADDLPTVGLSGKEFTSRIKTLGNAYMWSTAEIRAAAMTGAPIKSDKATLAKVGHDVQVNKIAWFGDADANLPGFLSNPNIPVFTVPANGTGASKLWANKTADQKIADMTGIVNSVKTQSLGVHRANELWLPMAMFTDVSTTPRGTFGGESILTVFKLNNPDVTVREVLELGNVATYAGQNVMVAIENSEQNLQLILPMAFKEQPPQPYNLAWKVPCESRVGGVVVEYPFAMAIGAGI